MESWNDKLWMFAVWLVATTTPFDWAFVCVCAFLVWTCHPPPFAHCNCQVAQAYSRIANVGCVLSAFTQFQTPSSSVSLYVSTSVSLSTASISIYLYRSIHLDMHPWFHEFIDSWGLSWGGWLLSPKCPLGVNTCAWLVHGQTILAKQLKRALALHNHTYTIA